MQPVFLFMVLLGCKPPGRPIEQHDLSFGIASRLADLRGDMEQAWPEARGRLHRDAWRQVSQVDGFSVLVTPREGEDKQVSAETGRPRLFFLNLGGYRPDEFEEFHYRMLVVDPDSGHAVREARQTAFYRHTGFAGAASPIDDKYGIDVDDWYPAEDILPGPMKHNYAITLVPADRPKQDALHLGYLTLENLAGTILSEESNV
ncbi:MAG TPA: DUF1543 domain-containing protein [Chitinophagaceae bacterium]|nr:DUF1543 domain-containing protein [Chitinophagaceae bacterium]